MDSQGTSHRSPFSMLSHVSVLYIFIKNGRPTYKWVWGTVGEMPHLRGMKRMPLMTLSCSKTLAMLGAVN